MNTIIGAVQAGLMGNDAIPKPRFILEVFPDFQIRDTNDRAVAQDLERLGFGIISYTWGRFQDKTTYEESLDAPKFDEVDKDGLPDRIRWYIPKLRNGAFTIKDVRGIIQRLNMKYVWWDWACIPQYWDSTDTTKPGTGPIVDPKQPPKAIGYLPERHKTIAAEEVAKQFYIYTLAKKGFIWMHNIEWVASQSPLKTAIQKTLEKGPRTKSVQSLTAAVAEVKTAVEDFQRMKQEADWLSSMWTFQEGILLNTDDVVDPRDNRVLATRNSSQFARIVDKKGGVFEAQTCFRGEATLLDITGRATLLACDISSLVIEAIETNEPSAAAELQIWLSRLYETGLVGVAADSPLDVLSAAKARGFRTMREEDYCVNAILGALRVVLPDGTPSGLGSPTDLTKRRTALLTALVARHGWRMLLLSKPTRGTWNASFPTDLTAGSGDWIESLLTKTWQFTPLGIFITSQIGRSRPANGPFLLPQPSSPIPTTLNGPGVDSRVLSLTQPVPYTDNVLLLGAVQARDHIALPQLRHASAVHAELGLHGDDAPDALVVGPESEDVWKFGDPAYGAFFYGVTVRKPQQGGGGGGGGVKVGMVAEGPEWTSCRFYASKATPPPANPGNFPVKTGTCFVKSVEYADREQTFGARVGVVLLPIEDVSVYKGTTARGGQGIERVVVVRCVVLTDFRAGPLRSGSDVLVGGGIFLGIGDFTFRGSPRAVPVEAALGKGWMIYMY